MRKMVTTRLCKRFFLLLQIIWEIRATTHWIVTENGRILSHFDSPFHLRRPYDLIALLDQETRRNDIISLYQELSTRAQQIDKKWSGLEGASDLEARIYSLDSDCLKADKLLSEIDLFESIATNGSSRGITYETTKTNKRIPHAVPNCEKYSSLDFSMFAYEHLPSMVNRKDLTVPNEAILEGLLPIPSLQKFGSELAISLQKNSSSWMHYNLAILYWRILGDAPKAIECGRRALFYSSRQYRDIPLLNIAGILHQARYSKDAAILLHAAIDHAPLQSLSYLALGNVYSVLNDYNRSVACYDNLLKLQPNMDEVHKTKHATLCHWKLTNVLMELHASLDETLSDLHDYHGQQQQLLRLQERLIWERAPFEAQMASYTSDKLGSVLSNRGQRCVQRLSADAKPTISCDFTDHHASTMPGLQADAAHNLQKLLQNVELETQKINEQMSRSRRPQRPQDISKTERIFEDRKERREQPQLSPKYSTSLTTSGNLYFDATGWPSKDECRNWNLPLKDREDLVIPVYLPPENKGFQIHKILTDYINLPNNVEHELPWHPPVCDASDVDFDRPYLPTSILKQLPDTPIQSYHHILKSHLFKYLDGKSEEAEIGQRIVTAIKKKAGPDWVLATLASLYWRVRSNTKNTLNCLNQAFKTVPKEYTDVLLVSISSVLHQVGLIDDAIKLATMAFKVNYVEPSTNFLLGLLHYSKNNPILAMYYMKNVLRVNPEYYDGIARKLLRTWACRIKTGTYEDIKVKEKVNEGMCSEKDSFQGEGVICSASGDQCKTAAIQCYRTDNPAEEASAEGSGGIEPDQSQLESMVDSTQESFHRRAAADDEKPKGGKARDNVFEEPVPEAVLHVYDKSGTYPLSPYSCKNIQEADWIHFTSMWQSIAARNVDISPFLKPLPRNFETRRPFCLDLPLTFSSSSSTSTLDHLTSMILRRRLPNSAEEDVSEWLGLMAGDQQATMRELGTKLNHALQENTTSWILATAAALYWRVIGSTEEAVVCLRQALTYAPAKMKDIPLVSLANLLNKIGFHNDALEIAYLALDSHPNFVVNHFTVGNIHTALGDLEKAISFYRSALTLDGNFEPARNRLQAILCTLLFDETGSVRETTEILEN